MDFDAHRIARGLAQMILQCGRAEWAVARRASVGARARRLDHEHGPFAQAHTGIGARQFVLREWIAVADDRAADFDTLTDPPLAIDAADPVLFAALIDFVTDA